MLLDRQAAVSKDCSVCVFRVQQFFDCLTPTFRFAG
jgi:hypothetical protein